MTPYQRVFGTGPRGLAFGLLSFALVLWLDDFLSLAPMHGSQSLSNVSLAIGICIMKSRSGVEWRAVIKLGNLDCR